MRGDRAKENPQAVKRWGLMSEVVWGGLLAQSGGCWRGRLQEGLEAHLCALLDGLLDGSKG